MISSITVSPAYPAGGETPRLVLSAVADPLVPLLEYGARLLLQHPAAAQAACSGLVAEGRRFAKTEEGSRWRSALAGSELVRRGRALWEGSVLSVLEESDDAMLPTVLLDAVVQAASHPDLTKLLQALQISNVRDDERAA